MRPSPPAPFPRGDHGLNLCGEQATRGLVTSGTAQRAPFPKAHLCPACGFRGPRGPGSLLGTAGQGRASHRGLFPTGAASDPQEARPFPATGRALPRSTMGEIRENAFLTHPRAPARGVTRQLEAGDRKPGTAARPAQPPTAHSRHPCTALFNGVPGSQKPGTEPPQTEAFKAEGMRRLRPSGVASPSPIPPREKTLSRSRACRVLQSEVTADAHIDLRSGKV